MIFVDSNVLIDVVAPAQVWREWSRDKLRNLGAEQLLVVNEIVIAELASGFPTISELRRWFDRLGVELQSLSDEPAFVGGLAFREYRQAGRERVAVLADFLIGGHASVLGIPLLTRDPRLYRRYFPDLHLITPETDP